MAFAATTDTITQWGITWTFDDPVEYGTFENGDYWVVAPVAVINMTPVWDDVNGRNGWEINPLVDDTQGFFTSTSYSSSKRPTMPFTINYNASLVKVIGGPSIDSSYIRTAAVLTILTSAPPNGGDGYFRPPYVGTSKPLYLVSSLRSDLLPSYATVSNAPTLDHVEADFSKCLRMDHRLGNPRSSRPTNAMAGYQPANTAELNDAMLRLMGNDSYETKLPALIQFTQHCIDQAYVVQGGYRRADNGHNPEHRILAAWAATLLDISAVKTTLSTATGFHEDYYLYDNIDATVTLFGESGYPERNYWNYIMGLGGSKSLADPYKYIDGGSHANGGAASYQNIVSQSLKGQALVFKLFPELQNCIPTTQYNRLENYAYRWVNTGVWCLPDPAAPYDGNNSNYGITYGPNGEGSYISGSGRFPDAHGAVADSGQYKSNFVASMWNAYYDSNIENTAPIADAGVDQSISSLSGTLAGSVIDDSNASYPVTCTWAMISGPGTVTFTDNHSLTSGFTLSAYGTYVIRLTCDDGSSAEGNPDTDDVQIISSIIDNNPPVISMFLFDDYIQYMLSFNITSLIGTDDTAITGWLIQEDNSTDPAASQITTMPKPTHVTASSEGTHTYDVWAVDAAGNIGQGSQQTVTITLPITHHYRPLIPTGSSRKLRPGVVSTPVAEGYSYTSTKGSNKDITFHSDNQHQVIRVYSGSDWVLYPYEDQPDFGYITYELNTPGGATASQIVSYITGIYGSGGVLTASLAPGSDGSGVFGDLNNQELV